MDNSEMHSLKSPISCTDRWKVNDYCHLVLFPSHVYLPVRNGLVNEVEFLGLITQKQ